MTGTTRSIVEQYWRAAQKRDWPDFGGLLHEDVVYDLPQTRERIRGRAAYIEFNRTYPGNWSLALESVLGDMDHAVSRVRFTIDGEEATGITFFDFKDGLIARITDYWPEPYTAPARPVPTERY